ncbi:MAG: GMC family oxidoreductase [Alteromonadaceae bacterium]|nr:MAG: GMC family oxidoreductase [Alteromonadaceae bacterium]
MLYDFDTDLDKLLSEYDYCVCGSGPSGMSVATTLVNAGKKVIILEGGGKQYSDRSQSLYESKSSVAGFNGYYSLTGTRARYLGGTSNFWSGRCKPFLEYEFSRSPGGDLPGWPITFKDMNDYLEPAMRIVDLDPEKGFTDPYDARLSTDNIEPDVFQPSPPTRFAQKYQDFMENNPGVHTFVNANVTELEVGEKGRISAVTVKSYDGQVASVKAKHFILAMGAIENARILLLSDSVYPKGVGNEHDMVGRCFMEHYNVKMGEFIPNPEYWEGREIASFYTTEKFVKEDNIGAANLHMWILGDAGSDQGGRLGPLRYMIQDFSCHFDLTDKLQWLLKHKCGGTGVITTLTEQIPNKDSRVTLLDDVDELGMRKINLHWDMNAFDARTIRTQAIRLAKDVAELKIGRVKLPEYITDESVAIDSMAHAHHIGTTRMAAEAKHGVVDSNAKVFGVDNLHVAGPSVFSTGGGGNPTMPGIQLALRLADHLLATETA